MMSKIVINVSNANQNQRHVHTSQSKKSAWLATVTIVLDSCVFTWVEEELSTTNGYSTVVSSVSK